MTMSPKDRALGMDRQISRRDFLDGIAIGAGMAVAGAVGLRTRGARADDTPYPPALTGLRGHNEGAYQALHAVRDGTFWASAGTPENTDESYDLVVVGG